LLYFSFYFLWYFCLSFYHEKFLLGPSFKCCKIIFYSFISCRWRDFDRSMFWLAVIGVSLVLLHVILLFIIKLRKRTADKQRDYGALTFPRFEIFLTVLALPCICKASASLVRGNLHFHFSSIYISPRLCIPLEATISFQKKISCFRSCYISN
jgi:hypothetical protein